MSEPSLSTGISSLRELRTRVPDSATRVTLIQPELSGGKTTREQIDAVLSHGASVVTMSGLDQNTFEYMIQRYGNQLVAVNFWKCPRINDFSPFEDTRKLTFAAFFWNQKATRLWDFSRTPSLAGLFFEDFRKLEELVDLAAARSLCDLEFGNGFSGRSVIRTLQPLASLQGLKSLSFNPSRILEGGIYPLANLTSLIELAFPTRLFPVEQIAWLRARLPMTLDSDSLKPTKPVQINGANLPVDTLVSGKGKPFLKSDKDAERIRRFVAQFDALVQMYRNNPELRPEV